MANRVRSLPAHWSKTPLEKILRPFQEFSSNSASGGIALLIATGVALILANSPLNDTYQDILHTKIGFTIGDSSLKESVLHWINDGLMAVFFFFVGLEIKREILVGELSNLRAALLPILAALGGAAVPALIYLALNIGAVGENGWGIPMATDIAFSLGVLALLGSRIPISLKVFLTAIAIVDDIIAILVIALFFSSDINFSMLAGAAVILALLFGLNLLGMRRLMMYIVLGLMVWYLFLLSGIHATIAGVLVAWTIPARNRIDLPTFQARMRSLIERLEGSKAEPSIMLTNELQQAVVLEMEEASEHVQAPLQKLEHFLHQPVALGIMPLFALANAGVAVSVGDLEGESLLITAGIVLGLVLGKPLGILAASWLVTRSGIAELPNGIRWSHVVGASCLAGIGFTMSLFIASLAFDEGPALEAAKTGILLASLLAALLGFFLLRRVPVEQAENAS